MDLLKSIFTLSFRRSDSLGSVIVGIIIYLIIGALAGVAIGILADIPVVKYVVGIIGTIVELYIVAGIVLEILAYLKIVK